MAEGTKDKQQGGAQRSAKVDRAPVRPAPGRETLTSDLSDGDGLPYKQKTLFESSLGRDLSGVRVHTDAAAAEKADQHGARAYAVGSDIHFARGQYQPGTPEGDQLLAHEVAHTQQQGGAAPTEQLATTSPGDRAEQNADTAAAAMTHGAPAQVTSEPVAIARKRADESIDVPHDAPANNNEKVGDAPEGGAPKADAKDKGADGPVGDLTVERVGAEEEQGSEPVGPPQNLEGGKAELAGKAAGLPPDGGAEELKAGGPKVDKVDGGGGGGDVKLTEELKGSLGEAQTDAHDATEQAKTEANAYKSEMKERRDRFDDQQQALTLEQLKTMSAADKRSTLIEMGYDANAVKKMKDAELAGLISGKLDTESRKTKILGMDPDELKALSPARKQQFLVDLGVDKEDLDKIGVQKSAQAFDDVMRVAHMPGQHKVKVKIKGGLFGKSWEINVKVDAQGTPDFDVQKEGGFFSKLWGWVKAALPIILTVLAPLTGGASLIVLAVYQTVTAIASGDWLGAIVGAAGAIVGVGALAGIAKSASAGAKAFKAIADVAGKVKNVAIAAKAAMTAAKAKSPGSLLSALASGASSFADFASSSAEKFQATMTKWSEKLDKWSKVLTGGEKVVAGVKAGDPAAAIGGAFDTAAAFASSKNAKGQETNGTAKNLQKYSRIAGYASAGQRAAHGKPPNYGAVVEAAMGIAGELKDSRKLEDAARITGAASKLTRAIQTNDPAQLAEAAVSLAGAIQLAKYDGDHPEEKGADGKAKPDDDREKIQASYKTATNVVRFAGAAIKAAAAKPRPNYLGALDAATNLIAELTEGKKTDQAARITSALDNWTNAVRSKDEMAIIRAGEAFGQAINGMADLIKEDRANARKAAEAKLAPGETLGEDDGGDIPRFETSVEVVGQAEVVPLVGPGIITTLHEPVAEVTTSEEFRVGIGARDNTPGANYNVIPGDTLSGIAQRFTTKATLLRSLNPQLVNDHIYVGQKLYVPGADVKLTPTVTTEESYKVDTAALDAASKAQLIKNAHLFVSTMQARIKAWRGENSLGADFYVYVRELDEQVLRLEHLTDANASADTIRSLILTINTAAQGVQRLHDVRRGTKDFLINAGIVVLPIVKDGCGIIISALATPAAAAGYAAVISSIESAFAGDGLGVGALKAAGAAFCESFPLMKTEGVNEVQKFLRSSVNQAFNNTSSAVADYFKELKSKKDMTNKEKRALKEKLAARIGVSIATSPLKGALETLGIEFKMNDAATKQLEYKLMNVMSEVLDKAVEMTLGPG